MEILYTLLLWSNCWSWSSNYQHFKGSAGNRGPYIAHWRHFQVGHMYWLILQKTLMRKKYEISICSLCTEIFFLKVDSCVFWQAFTCVFCCCSGTLSYLFNSFVGTRSFSEVVTEAKEAGYTEPDPRDDLSGTDVARKVLYAVIVCFVIQMITTIQSVELVSAFYHSC